MEKVKPEQQSQFESPWSFRVRLLMLLWEWTWLLLCSWTPKPLNDWRLIVLRVFGATIKGKPFVHQKARILIPWNLALLNRACLGDRTNAYSLGLIEIGENATIAQEAYLCTGTHDFQDPAIPLEIGSIKVGENAFIGARAMILPGVKIGKKAVVGAQSVVTKDVQPSTIVAGNPARKVGNRLDH
tara:strand:- start:226 stop:780 length:555 start_codon:yes stop_codon:yes gene_type:complete